MAEIRQTDVFADWIRHLRDHRGRAKILARIDRLALGNPGDVKPVGEGVSELRVNFGPGYRVYFVKRGGILIILLCGGTRAPSPATYKPLRRWRHNWSNNNHAPKNFTL